MGYYSDKTQQRGLFVFLSYTAVFVGFLLAVAPSSFIPGLTYAGCFVAACGIYPGMKSPIRFSEEKRTSFLTGHSISRATHSVRKQLRAQR